MLVFMLPDIRTVYCGKFVYVAVLLLSDAAESARPFGHRKYLYKTNEAANNGSLILLPE